MGDNKLTDQNVSAIDKALAAAKARKEAKGNGSTPTASGTGTTSTASPATPKAKLTDEEKAAKQAQRDAERNERKAKRDADRAEKVALRNASRQPAHMKKVQKAAEKLGTLGQASQLLFNEATSNLSAAELAVLALHIQHFNREKATERALGAEIKPGQTVRIVEGDPRYIGQTGTVIKTQRIRCYVHIEGGNNRPVPGTDASGVYFFTSDVTPVQASDESDTEETPSADNAVDDAPAAVAV